MSVPQAHYTQPLPLQGNIRKAIGRGNAGAIDVQYCKNKLSLTADVEYRKKVGVKDKEGWLWHRRGTFC